MRPARWQAAGAALAFAATIARADNPGLYTGAAVCGGCHPSQYEKQSRSAHAKALSKTSDHAFAGRFAPGETLFRPPRYRFEFSTGAGTLEVRISDASDELVLPIEWAFGAGEQAVTFVSRKDESWHIEHYFSWYRRTGRMGATPGHEALRSNQLALAAGYLYRSLDPVTGIVACFRCHSTGPPQVSRGNEVAPLEAGVRCEACHGPGQAHARGVPRGIRNPKRMRPAEVNLLCGECHRSPENAPELNLSKAWNVRFQAAYLMQSACYRRGEELSCVTCHDPHGGVERDPESYNRKCSNCHQSVETGSHNAAGDCVSCHMPVVTTQPNLRFANHWIGIYSRDNPLQPRGGAGR
jgi:hypothetical protein